MKPRLLLVLTLLVIVALRLASPSEMQRAVEAGSAPSSAETATSTPLGLAYLPLVTNRQLPLLTPTASATSMPTASATPAPSATPSSANHIPPFSHIFTIVMENEAYEQIIGNTRSAPYINSLAQQYGLATNYYGITHPSLPNYISLIGGDTLGIVNDCTDCFVNAPNLVDQLESAGKSWKAYMEDMPSSCFIGDSGPLYRQKHNPFIYFDDIRLNAARCTKLVPFTQFATDLQANRLPDYVWIGPNMCHDIHDCPLADGDAWLQSWVAKILASPAWQQNGVLFITWDEGRASDNTGCCQYANGGHILTLVLSRLGKPAYQSSTAYAHYSLLRTIEEAWGLPALGKAECVCSAPMEEFFSAVPAGRRP